MAEVSKQRLSLESGGVRLEGELVMPADSETLIVLCHGIPLSAPDPSDGGYPVLTEAISKAGIATLFFNLRGTGLSGGNFHLDGWFADLERVMDFVRAELPSGFRLVLAGFSAGGALSIRYAATHGGVAGVAAFAAVADYPSVFKREEIPGFLNLAREVGIIREEGFPPDPDLFYREIERNGALRYVSRVSPIPLFLVHGAEDDLVPVEQALALYRAAGEPRELVLLPGGRHRLRQDPRALECLIDWVRRLT